MKQVLLPELIEGMDRAIISYWHVEEGDPVEEGDNLAEVSIKSQTYNVPCPFSGILNEILFEDGDEVEEGEAIATIEEGEENFGFEQEQDSKF